MATALKEINQWKGKYYGSFSLDNIPIYLPPTSTPELPYLVRSYEKGQGYTDVFISAKIDGMPTSRKIRNLFMCYRPFTQRIEPEIKEVFDKINRETAFSLRIKVAPHYRNFGTAGPGVFVQQLNEEEQIPIDEAIGFLEAVERALVENVRLYYAKLKKEKGEQRSQ